MGLHTATGVEMMLAAGFSSVNSATWVRVAGFGGIMVQTDAGVSFIRVSSDSPERRFSGHHYDKSYPGVDRLSRTRLKLMA